MDALGVATSVHWFRFEMTDQFITISPKKNRIFLATTDSVVQAWYPETRNEITRQIKLLTLLGYQVVFGAPFVWQSKHTQAAIQTLSPLVEVKLLGVMGRERVETATEYLQERQEDTSKLEASVLPTDHIFATEVPTTESIILAKSLDTLSSLIPRNTGVEANFADLFLKDLSYMEGLPLDSYIRSILPTNQSMLARRTADGLSTKLKDLTIKGHFSRASIYLSASDNSIPLELLEAINLRSTTLFHASNAIACDATLFTWANIAASVPPGIKFAHQYSIAPENPYLLQETLKVFGVSPQVIDNIPLDTIIRLATEAPEVDAFVKWYKQFISGCEVSSGNYANSASEAEPLLWRISKQREQTISSDVNRKIIVNEEKSRLSWYVGALGAMTMAYFGAGAFKVAQSAFTAVRHADTALKILRNQCEKSVIKPLGDFEALVIREGLRDSQPEKYEGVLPVYHKPGADLSFNEILRPFF